MNPTTNEQPKEINILGLEGFIPTVNEDPSATGILSNPKKFSEQFVIATTGGSSSAYIYDTANQTWKRVALT